MTVAKRSSLFWWRRGGAALAVGLAANISVTWALALLAQREVLTTAPGEANEIVVTDTPSGHSFRGFAETQRVVESLTWPVGGEHQGDAPDVVMRMAWPWWHGFDTEVWTSGNPDEPNTLYLIRESSVGLPMRSMSGYVFGYWTGPEHDSCWSIDTGLAATCWAWPDQSTVRLPARPMVAGFLVNTIFYGSLLLGPLVLIDHARHRFRAKRGRCNVCGYELAGLPICPECGATRIGPKPHRRTT